MDIATVRFRTRHKIKTAIIMGSAFYGFVDFTNTKHRYILSLCYQLGWTVIHPKLNRTVVDSERLGKWIRERSKFKKPLKQHNDIEIGTIILALEQILKNKTK